jgi:hypothetical protein
MFVLKQQNTVHKSEEKGEKKNAERNFIQEREKKSQYKKTDKSRYEPIEKICEPELF